MKVLMIAPEPFREPRGTPISIYQRIHALASLGHTIDLATYHLGEDIDIPGVKIHRIPSVPFIKKVRVGPSWSKLFLDILVFCKAVTMLLRGRYDVIHSHEEAAFFSIILAAIFRTRHIYDMHSSLPRQLLNFRFGHYRPIVKLFAVLERWAVNSCDAVITIGSDLEDHVRTMNPTKCQARIENLPVQTGMSTDQRAVVALKQRLGLHGRIPIVYTGTFERYQGLDLLIGSAAIVKEHHPAAVFLLVGGRPEQIEYWENEARTQHLDDTVLFAGTVPLEEMPVYLEAAEILVSPRTGGISVPLKLYTYLFSGKPIVATNLITHTLVLSEDIAVLAAPTKEAFAEGIMRLLRAPDLRQHLGRQARTFAEERFNPADYPAKLDQVYRGLQTQGCVAERSAQSVKG